MPAAILALTFGLILIRAGWKGISFVDAALGRDSQPKVKVNTPDPFTGPVPSAVGTKVIDGKPVALWIYPLVIFARRHGWPGVVTSGWRDPHVTVHPSPGLPVAPQGESNHRGIMFPLGAVDVTHPDEFEAALRKFPGPAPLRRDPAIHDPVHFSSTGR